ncbi:MAG: hypothetical protein IKP29_09740 [Pseudobutyrivibrio sp.]|nr:hypothetical protein [Pseudobutyrivibrio sp.]
MRVINRIASFMLVMALVVTTFLATPITAEAAKKTTKKAAATGVTVAGAAIQDGNVVVISSGAAASDDGLYHLVASDAISPGNVGADVAQAPVAANASFVAPLGFNTANSLLFKKFTVCVNKGGVLTPVSNSMYITNPEATAVQAGARVENGKKGLGPSPYHENVNMRTPQNVGAKQAVVTFELSKANGGGVGRPYVYNGKTYYFESRYISHFDNFICQLYRQGCQVTVILVADQMSPANCVSPYAPAGAGHSYYAFNGSTSEGLETLGALASYLTQRWTNSTYYGMRINVDNFIIGNEVNAWNQWNYSSLGPNLAAYTQEYANAFRVMYNGIKSQNANANVYVCTDHQWALNQKTVYGAKTFLTQFNTVISSQGNIDWRLAFHAYDYPLTNNQAWLPTGNVQRNQNTKFVSVYNIEEVTDFLCQPAFLSPTGQVRTVKLSEQGYTSATSDTNQAASIVYAIMVANSNRYIDGIIIAKEKDDPYIEMPQGLSFGILTPQNQKKLSYDFYAHAEDPNYIAQASALAGVDLTTQLAPR